MATYRCDKMRAIRTGDELLGIGGEMTLTIESAKDAATAFAQRIARKIYGKRGYVHHVRLDCAAANGRYANYEAFVGIPAYGGGTSGQNIWLTVYVQPEAPAGNLGVWQ